MSDHISTDCYKLCICDHHYHHHHHYHHYHIRCLQTANQIGLAFNVAVAIEPGLTEIRDPVWYPDIVPIHSVDELIAAGLNIDTSYSPFVAYDELPRHEYLSPFISRTLNLKRSMLLASMLLASMLLASMLLRSVVVTRR
jgi:hypothetical protein